MSRNSRYVEDVLSGLIDSHSHPAPSAMPREFDAAAGARDGWERLRMRAMVFKCHHHNTQMDVLAQQPLIADIPTEMIGAVALNSSVGGLNLAQVQMCLGLGGKVVYLPTVSSRRHIANHAEDQGFPATKVDVSVRQIDVIDDEGSVRPELLPIFDYIASQDAVLNAGHLHPDDSLACFVEAKGRGVSNLVLSHPDFVIEADPDRVSEFVGLGTMIEHELHMYDPGARMRWPLEQLLDWIRTVGPENTLIGSDLGQKGFPWPADAYVRVAEGLLDLGLAADDLRTIVHDNPRRLFGICD